VLVADDQSDIRDALRLLLRREGYEIHGAASPSEALAALEAREFDAVLMILNPRSNPALLPGGRCRRGFKSISTASNSRASSAASASLGEAAP